MTHELTEHDLDDLVADRAICLLILGNGKRIWEASPSPTADFRRRGNCLSFLSCLHTCSDCGEITSMNEYRTIKIWLTTYRQLKQLAALTGETTIKLLDRLIANELKRVQK